ncbi:unnamed protein product [Meganyctiphanes norvegica]|uniref:Uncharacterized protein n=1 Tax=Meganyctiphanes norvegica TaxID=48144 RepID=A0AAV2Q381_MEGNR
MKSIYMVGVIFLCGSCFGDKYSSPQPSYHNPPSDYGTPPKPHYEKCYPQKCTDAIIITKTGFQSSIATHTITSIIPVQTQSLTTTIFSTDITHTKTVCNPVPTVVYNVKFDTSTSTHIIHECIPTQHTKVITNYIPQTIPVTINQCSQSLYTKTAQSLDVIVSTVPVTTFTFTATTKEWTTYQPTSSMEYWPICTESLKCDHGYGHTQKDHGYGHTQSDHGYGHTKIPYY